MKNIISSLNRIEGQVRGIKKMHQEGRDCEKIIQQIAAVQSALASVGKKILTNEAVECIKKKAGKQDIEKLISSAIKIS